MFFSRLPAVRHCEDGEDRQRQLDIPEPDDVGRDDMVTTTTMVRMMMFVMMMVAVVVIMIRVA